MRIISANKEVNTRNNTTSAILEVRIFSKKMKIVKTIVSGDLAHCKLEESGVTMADKYLNRQINKFKKGEIF